MNSILSPLDLVSALLTGQTEKLNISSYSAADAAEILSQNRQIVMILTTSVAVLIGCVVVAVGPGVRDKSGNTIPVSVKEGDTVLLPEYGGTQVKLGDKEYHIYRDEDILGTLHD